MKTFAGFIRFSGPLGKNGQKKTKSKKQEDHTKRKGGFDGERTRTELRYQATRDARAALGICSKTGAALRKGIPEHIGLIRGRELAGRLNGMFMKILSCDPNESGNRSIARGLGTAEGRSLLLQFSFQKKRRLSANIKRHYAVNMALGQLVFRDFVPKTDLLFPKGTKMAGLQFLIARIDLDNFFCSVEMSDIVVITQEETLATHLTLTSAIPAGNGVLVGLLFSGYCDVYRSTLRFSPRLETVLEFVGLSLDANFSNHHLF